ncbi:hypothetical protein DCAR_0103895 [Daucus carota subsp. sativus]|uniref:Erythronate-4-phosphate dehydrogenase family protein n=1 Tax=Daucus carota subsp. sativus TaxID=79200 RepID=A0A166IDL1_DAUCS|nr:PREDICTED: uncharacterized protein At1g01500-like [Daucus carota subsp. sativus]XP_017229645.1 PREDICTED: uncharacterized protein At1g01500-like [Daucus carota subsp. sativus]XP_017229646.1 PREDICTED: uncharacterized protein At1g01500-like [Daucus carota subsp. sativus]XP_017229647.1 PREDICTED: uncharacterized protein At1g01500-like [Daucus carota subsp. sativus]XP_017229648.1 PREDICTED: uncharacterized protein At1g01500-like [Daucus carota subsp. sativus]WOG84711.1 hypothetical protein DCA
MENSHEKVNGYSNSTRDLDNSHMKWNGNGVVENGHGVKRHTSYQPSVKLSLSWLDIRVFYVRVSKCDIDDSTPECLTLNHIPLNHETLLEVNGARTSIYSDGASTLLRRDRFDKKSEEVTYVSTDSLRMTGSVKFEVFNKDVLVISGLLESSQCTGSIGDSENHGQRWSMHCESDIPVRSSLFNAKQCTSLESPEVEVYVAGCFSGVPIILTKTLQLGSRKKQSRKGMLKSIPEYEATVSQKDVPAGFDLQVADYSDHKPENEEYNPLYHPGMQYLEGEDGELSWFTAGVRVGVGIGLSVCLGVGIGVGLLVKTYQGTTRNFRRRLF